VITVVACPSKMRAAVALIAMSRLRAGVDDDERDRPDHPAGQRVVVANDRVLHHIAQQEGHDEVERAEVRKGIGQHPTGTIADNLIDQQRGRSTVTAAGLVGHDGEHGSYLPDRRWRAGLA
jgi:hypothetical protein